VAGLLRRAAVAVLVTGFALSGAQPAAGQNSPATAFLEKAGWDALNAGDAHAAAEHFRDALASDPGNAWLHVGAGLAAYLERRDDAARAALERALSLDSELMQARTILAQVRHRQGDLAGAVAMLEGVVSATSDDRAAQTLRRWRREMELHDRMQQAIGAHFTVSFEGPSQEGVAREALASLDRAYWRIGALLGTFPTTAVPLVLYTAEQFRDITRSPAWAAAAFDGVIRVPVRGALEQGNELDRVLAHEFTHALVRDLAPHGVPAWLNEGLASALEADVLTWAGEVVRRAGAPAPLSALAKGFGGLDGPRAQLAYATSALAVRRLLDEAGGAAVVNLLRDLGEGVDFEAAFLHRIQRSFNDWVIG
jgi:Tfp pilus assembly protein PilF